MILDILAPCCERMAQPKTLHRRETTDVYVLQPRSMYTNMIDYMFSNCVTVCDCWEAASPLRPSRAISVDCCCWQSAPLLCDQDA